MNEYLIDLFQALKKVDKEFYVTKALLDPTVKLDGATKRETFIQLTERQFAAELYHKWRETIESSKNDYSNLKIGFEVSKKFIQNQLVEDKSSFIPDLVLHQSQVNFDPDFQKIYLEIKTTPSQNAKRIKHDLNKILFAMKQYGFQNGIFISINSDYKRLLKLIKNYIIQIEKRNLHFEDCWSNFYLFHSDENGVSLYNNFEGLRIYKK